MNNEVVITVPIWEKYMLTIKEAAMYFGIGEHKLRELLDTHIEERLAVWNGNRQLVNRKKMEAYLNDCSAI